MIRRTQFVFGAACCLMLACDPLLTVRGRVASAPLPGRHMEELGDVTASGRALRGARVSLDCPERGSRALAETDAQGWFVHSSIGYAHENCSIWIREPGHLPQSFSVRDACAVRGSDQRCYAVAVLAELVPLSRVAVLPTRASARPARVSFHPQPASLTLLRAVERAPDLVAYDAVCRGPCNARVQSGEHVFAVALRGRSAIAHGVPLAVTGPVALRVRYEDHSGARSIGRYVGAPTALGGLALMLAAVYADSSSTSRIAFAGSGLSLLVGGSILAVFTSRKDEIDVDLRPLPR